MRAHDVPRVRSKRRATTRVIVAGGRRPEPPTTPAEPPAGRTPKGPLPSTYVRHGLRQGAELRLMIRERTKRHVWPQMLARAGRPM